MALAGGLNPPGFAPGPKPGAAQPVATLGEMRTLVTVTAPEAGSFCPWATMQLPLVMSASEAIEVLV